MKKDPPESGTSPMLMNAGTKVAESAAMRRSHAHASERPAPAAAPLTAAITGFSRARIARHIGVVGAAEPVGDVVGRITELGQVLADTEASTRPCDHHRPDLVGARFPERGCEPLVDVGVERVELVGPVERDRQDGAVPARQDRIRRHVRRRLGLGSRLRLGRALDFGHRRNLGAFRTHSCENCSASVIRGTEAPGGWGSLRGAGGAVGSRLRPDGSRNPGVPGSRRSGRGYEVRPAETVSILSRRATASTGPAPPRPRSSQRPREGRARPGSCSTTS